jgi:hypothetical protein
VIDRTEATSTSGPSGAAQRRVFHSKVDTIRPTYGFEDVSLAPGVDTIEPADVDLRQTFCGIDLAIPILASAMDAVVDARMAGALARLGGLAILNLEGVQTRYDEPAEVLERIAAAADGDVQAVLAEAYQAPIREELIARRLDEIHAAGSRAAGSGRSAPSTARTCSWSRARSRPPATWRPNTTRCRSPSSPATCRSRSRSATRPTPRRPSR